MTNMVNWSVSWLSSLCTIVDTSRGLGSGPLDTDLSGQIMWLQGVCLKYSSSSLYSLLRTGYSLLDSYLFCVMRFGSKSSQLILIQTRPIGIVDHPTSLDLSDMMET